MQHNPLTLGEFGTLREGLLATANKSARPLSKFGVDFAITPQDAVLGSLPAVGGLYNIANALNQARVNQIARGQVGQEPLSFFQEVTKGDFSATQELQNRIKDEYGAVNRDTVQQYFMKNNPELDLAPQATFTKNFGQIPKDTAYTEEDGQYRVTQPFKSGSFAQEMKSRAGSADGRPSFYDLEEQGRFKEAQQMYDANLKSVDQFAEDNIKQSNIKESKNFDKDFARAVTIQQQKEQGTYDTDTGDGPTFICTALYNQGLLPRKIYACDVIYGKGINFYTYKGYEVWGKWFAKKLKNNKMVFKIFHPVFVQWANQMAFEVSGGKYGKNNTFIKILKRTGETISNIIGRIAERRKRWSTQ
tara:strand:+ start:120 stop:1199 length:1080 start_codon:yes stop_codon:yes gene_type:complete